MSWSIYMQIPSLSRTFLHQLLAHIVELKPVQLAWIQELFPSNLNGDKNANQIEVYFIAACKFYM